VECYSGQTADERPIRFRLDGHAYMIEEVLDQWYGPSEPISRFGRMTATFTSCAGRQPRRPRERGIWNRFGDCPEKGTVLSRMEAAELVLGLCD